ncbi:Ferrous iron transport peroxidase EfeB [Klebsiella pneumoniae]|uniref:Ferrous iron transport peroxidase EfeB n=1 Tax=Klebsiella pneumoniae TaxID=573 RepID=A0A2X3F0H0_KLEPN|nr:Ferrous iron transport peroxidase EfeB [Klebsiella pneumoniae]
MQKRLNGEALEEYVKPIGGATSLFTGVVDDKHYLGESLLQALIPTLPVRVGRFLLFFSFFLYFLPCVIFL